MADISRAQKYYLSIECLTLMFLMPVLVYVFMVQIPVVPKNWVLGILWCVAAVALWWLRKQPGGVKHWFRWRSGDWQYLKWVLVRFAISAAAIAAFTYLYHPEKLFGFAREKTAFWALVMLAYPILSVIPQEILYRPFFFQRYGKIFSGPVLLILMSGISFGLAHLLFNNPIAITLSTIGGVMFSYSYWRHKSFLLVWIEHALYGDFLFTIGLGRFFYHGGGG